ncbi:buccalin-like [Coccinella septempunctata]|uniref:buccalin-like n=1 Tax=Coccinella septempunctata TaxID=41139 RepID=UPI001D0983CD|nr:buccalin-like [Coccinella septempunctata]
MMINVTFTLLALLAVYTSCVPMYNRREEYLRELAAIDKTDAEHSKNMKKDVLDSDNENGNGRIFVINLNNDLLLKKIIDDEEDAILHAISDGDIPRNDIVDELSVGVMTKKDSSSSNMDMLRKRALDSIGGGALLGKRALDSIGGGALLGKRALDRIGGGALLGKRALDSIGGGALLGKRSQEFLEKRALDSIGGGALLGKRALDSIGGGALLGKRSSQNSNMFLV